MTPKKILVVKNRALGDSIIGLSAIMYLKQLFPNSELTYGVPEWIYPFYLGVETKADHLLSINLDKTWNWPKLFFTIFSKRFDLIIELHQSGRTSIFFKGYSLLTNTQYRFHNHNVSNFDQADNAILDQGVTKASMQRDLDGCWSAVSNILNNPKLSVPSYTQFQPSLKIKNNDLTTKPVKFIIFGVVATRKTKMWPLTNYLIIAKKILECCPEVKILIPLSNSKDDQNIEKEITSSNPPSNIEIIKSPLKTLPHYLVGALLYLGNDTGLKHICAALGVVTYTFFGPEEPLEWHPYDQSLHKFFFIPNLPCRTVTSHFCGIPTCDHLTCQTMISPVDVWEQLHHNFK